MATLSGKSFGKYHIIEQLGQGGMASVYKAYDTHLERYVAVKVILPTHQHSETFLKRFDREAKALAQLTHPNIIPIIDSGDQEGIPYLVMPFLPGGTIKHEVGKPFSWQEAVRILLPITRALAYAHNQGIIHRDVKPSNILLTHSGEPMLTDFGIARLLDSEETASLTSTGMTVGTPEYMAPEQWLGQVSAQVDIYALGVVLYEMVTGRKPYSADTPAAVLLKAMNEPLPRPRSFVPGLPEKVEEVLYKALAKKPEERYSDMGAFANALEKLNHQESVAGDGSIETLPAVFPVAHKESLIETVSSGREDRISEGTSLLKPVEWVRQFLYAGLPVGAILLVVALACMGIGYVLFKDNPGLFKQPARPTEVTGTQPALSQPSRAPTPEAGENSTIDTLAQTTEPSIAMQPTPTISPILTLTLNSTDTPGATQEFHETYTPWPTPTNPIAIIPILTVSVRTNCREGPSTRYSGRNTITMEKGESAEVWARSPGDWLLVSASQLKEVRITGTRAKCCWVYKDEYVTLNVSLSSIRLINYVPDRTKCELP